jgi:hypothetical protein
VVIYGYPVQLRQRDPCPRVFGFHARLALRRLRSTLVDLDRFSNFEPLFDIGLLSVFDFRSFSFDLDRFCLLRGFDFDLGNLDLFGYFDFFTLLFALVFLLCGEFFDCFDKAFAL